MQRDQIQEGNQQARPDQGSDQQPGDVSRVLNLRPKYTQIFIQFPCHHICEKLDSV